MTWRENITPDNRCPYCGLTNDRASDPTGDAVPKRGDISVCIRCGGVGLFTRSLRVRKPSPAELAEAMANPKVRRLQAAIRGLPTRR
jgi:hypothetical protein